MEVLTQQQLVVQWAPEVLQVTISVLPLKRRVKVGEVKGGGMGRTEYNCSVIQATYAFWTQSAKVLSSIAYIDIIDKWRHILIGIDKFLITFSMMSVRTYDSLSWENKFKILHTFRKSSIEILTFDIV